MNTQLERPKAHTANEEDTHIGHDQDVGVHLGHEHEEHHGEKKSVLKKVKAKAKKIKDTIKEHVGHGHEVHKDDDELDTDPKIHGTIGPQGVSRQHEPKLGERTGGEGVPLVNKPSAYQTFDPTTARYTSGQDQTLDWPRTDTGLREKVPEEQSFAPRNTPVGNVLSSGVDSHSIGSLDVGKKGPRVKYGGIIERRTGVEIDTRDPRNVGDLHSAIYQDKTSHQTSIGSTAAQNISIGLHRSDLGERATMEGVTHAPTSKPQGYGSAAAQSITPGLHRSNVGERATMEGVTHAPTSRPQGYGSAAAESITPGFHRNNTGERATMQGVTHAPTSKPQGYVNAAAQNITPGLHRSNLGERATMKGVTHVPTSSPQGPITTLVFESKTTSFVPAQEETLGWSTGKLREPEEHTNALKNTLVTTHPTRSHGGIAEEERDSLKPQGIIGTSELLEKDPHGPRHPDDEFHHGNYKSKVTDPTGMSRTNIGMPRELSDQSNVFKNTPTATHPGRTQVTRAEEENAEKLRGILGRGGNLEKDLQGPGGPGEELHPGNYESKVTDLTGEGGEEMGVTPILHKLDKMNIHDSSLQKPTPRIDQEESLFKPDYCAQNEELSTGSHDQFYPEAVSPKTSPFLETSDSGFQFNSKAPESKGRYNNTEHNQGSYTDKISSAATMVANKAKQATSSVTSKLGYGGSGDNQTEHGGYGSVTTTIADKAVQAKDAIATKLGYGGTDEGEPMQEGESKGGLIIETMKDKIAAGYDKVADAGSTMASKVQGTGTYHEPGPTTVDKGVSMKEYLVEKLKPGEEDKALSEVITEALPLHKPKEDISKPEQDAKTNKVVITGRVTESDEVARRLGRSADKSYDDAGVGFARPGKGVMDRIYEATNSWFHKSGEDPANTPEGNQSFLSTNVEHEQKLREEPRLQ